MELDLEELAAIVELLDKADFTEFRFEKGDVRIAVSRGGTLPDVQRPAQQSPRPQAAKEKHELSAASVAHVAEVGSGTTAGTGQDVADNEVLVRAPMLGTFYRSPKPGDPAFVEIGDEVKKDTVVCIIEVMKLMNSVPSGVAGELVRVLAIDGELVEFDQPLFVVRQTA